jgi:hypothetical protein
MQHDKDTKLKDQSSDSHKQGRGTENPENKGCNLA